MVVLRYFEGCPNVGLARERLNAALRQLGEATAISMESISTGESPGTVASPTILINGRDPFPSTEGASALSCRLYETPDGLQGSPTVDQLVEALRAAGPLGS